MNKQSLESYLDFIQKLLNCSPGEEWRFLQQHQQLINPELVQMMEQLAKELAAEGDLKTAKILHHWQTQLTHLLQQKVTVDDLKNHGRSRAYQDLIQALLDCPNGSEAQILIANRDLIDSELVKQMKQLAVQTAEQGDRDTANFLKNLAIEIEKTFLKASVSPDDRQETKAIEIDRSSLNDPWDESVPVRETESAASQPSFPQEDSKPTSVAKGTSIEPQIADSLAAIARSLVKLEETLTARLQPADPLWYMNLLESACASNWILTTEEIEKLIGVKPKCEAGKDSYQRGCWLFVKAGKMGSQTGWRVIKAKDNLD